MMDNEIKEICLSDDTKTKLDNNLNIIKENNEYIKEKLLLFSKICEYVKILIDDFNVCKEDLIKRIMSFVLSLSITIGSGVGIFFVSKKISYHDYYKKITTSYSSQKGLDNKVVLIDKNDAIYNSDGEIYLNVYGLWEKVDNDNYRRVIKKYDVSNYKFDNIEDYLEYNIDYYNVDYKPIVQEKSILNDLYINEYTEVEKSIVDKSEKFKYFDIIKFTLMISILYSIYLFVILGTFIFYDDKFFWGKYKEFNEYLKKYKDSKKLVESELKNLERINNEILEKVNSNNLLKDQFNKLYEENKFLLDNPEELYNKFNSLANEIGNIKVKKLVK